MTGFCCSASLMPMRTVTGSRERVAAELSNIAGGCLADDAYAAAAAAALADVEAGATQVTAGHSVYVIDGASSQAVPPDVQSA